MEVLTMTLGEQIKQAREMKNMSQEELAFQLGISRQAVSKWENNLAVPQGINKDMMKQILEVDVLENEVVMKKKNNLPALLGWAVLGILAITLILICIKTVSGVEEKVEGEQAPTIKSITFYDENQEIVDAEALWYNSANIESILVQWEGGTPNSIQMFATPSGSETLDETELLLTKAVKDGDRVELLDADPLKDGYMLHVYFQLDFGNGNIIISDLYNIFYDENMGEM